MKTGRTAFKNAAVLTAGRFISRIAQFFMFIYAARSLGVDHFGIFSFAQILVGILRLFMELGLSRYSVQQMSRDLKNTSIYLGASLLVKSLLVIVGYIFIIFIGLFFIKDMLTMKVLLILFTAAVLDILSAPFSSVFDAHEEMFYSAIIILVSNSIMSIIGLAVIFYFKNLIIFCTAITFGSFLRSLLYVIWYYKKYESPSLNFDFKFIKDLIKNGFIFSLSSIFLIIYSYIDSIMLNFFSGSESVGYYNASYRLLDAPLFLIESVIVALFPAISRLHAGKSDELNQLVSKSFNIGLAVGLSIASAVAFLSEKLIYTIYGEGYAPSSTVLPILIFSVAFIMPAAICNTAIQATDRQHLSLFIGGGGAILNILLNLFLIPRYSFKGAAWATLITELIIGGIYIKITKKYLAISVIEIKNIFKSLILSCLLLSYLYLMESYGLLFQITGCVVLFLPFSLIAGVFSLKELKSI